MNKRTKTFLMICGIVIGSGLILGIIGMAFGGAKGLAAIESRFPWISFGGSGQVESINENTGAFTSVVIDGDLGSVEFVEGDKYGVAITYNKKWGAPTLKNENGKLTVMPSGRHRGWFNFNWFGISDDADTAIKVYYPKETSFDAVKINNDMGDVMLNNVKSQKLNVTTSAGDVKMSRITADEIKLDADMGDIDASGIQSGGTDIQASAGSMDLSGAFAGNTKISCDMGSCTLTTSLPKETYAIETRVDMGDCKVDGRDVGSYYTVENAAASNRIKAECDAGELELNFR